MPAANSCDVALFGKRFTPARIVLLYLCAGIVWIIFSDALTAWIIQDLQNYEYISVLKGLLFVAATSGLLYLLIRNNARQLQSSLKTFQHAEQEIKKLAYFDHETGLPNHNLLLDRLNQVIAYNNRKQKNTAVVYISLTGFKAVVDAHGHSGGSEAVVVIAKRLASTLRQYDTVARIHRDEFVLVLGGSLLDGDVSKILHKLKTVFSEPLHLGKDKVIIPACFGVACFPADGATSEVLLQNAHIAMNQARQNGTSFQYYSADLNQKAVDRLSIETGLLRALDDEDFFFVTSPKWTLTAKMS